MQHAIVPEDAFNTALVELIPPMRAFARALCRGDPTLADDLTQQALLQAIRHRDQFRAGTNMKAWTFAILRNAFISQKRRASREEGLDPELAEETLVATTNADAPLELGDVRRALGLLSDDQREALILVGAGGLSYEEAAEICEISVGTVKSRVSRARARLASILDSGGAAADGAPPTEMRQAIRAA